MIDLSAIPNLLGDYTAVLPMIILLAGALIIPGLAFIKRNNSLLAFVAEMFIIAAAVMAAFAIIDDTNTYLRTFEGIFTLDSFSALMMLLFLGVAGLVVLISPASPETTKHIGEYYSLLLIATSGMLFVASANNLLAIFVGVECVSISSYALVTLKKNDPRAAEAGVKYLLIGGMSSALTLYGISMIYGVTGSIEISVIASQLDTISKLNLPFIVGIIAMIAGYGFKISAVPFHMWAPDVYEGASTPVTAFLATASKKMGFAVLFKIFFVLFALSSTGIVRGGEIQMVFAIIAALTMTVGNVVAISQDNIKRMLAYSSIAQAGYILIALAVMSKYAMTGSLFHMFTHVFMKGGAFIVVAALITAGVGEKIADYKGLAKRSPLAAAAMLIFLFSLAGIPPLAGFTSKFVLFGSAIYDPINGFQLQWLWLVLIAVLNSAISLYYYARVVKAMYVDEGESTEKLKLKKSHVLAILICVAFVIFLGVWPEPLLNLCSDAAAMFFGF